VLFEQAPKPDPKEIVVVDDNDAQRIRFGAVAGILGALDQVPLLPEQAKSSGP
jgi:hypothetical protein